MAKDDKAANPLLHMAGAVTEEHLAEVEAKIMEKETELAALKRLRSLGMTLLGKNKPRGGPRKPQEPKAAREPFDVDAKRRQIVRYLANGPKNGQEIMRDCGLGGPKFAETMDHLWFNKSATGYHITTLARQQAM